MPGNVEAVNYKEALIRIKVLKKELMEGLDSLDKIGRAHV